MKTSRLASVGLIGLAYGSIMVMSAADAPRDGSAAASKEAAKQAERTAKALGQRDAGAAVAAAERAVAFAPRVAGYRMLLGQSYMQAGRFASARQAFADTLALDGSNGKAALNLALAQIAGGDWQAARATLGAHTDVIPAGDRGLALALAGDTQAAVALLTEVARSQAATPKIRQNLALSYALAGQWQEARVVAAADMSPADVDARLEQWAAFAQPNAASDQVASLLGVRPVADGGQPVALALHTPAAPVAMAQVEAAAPAPVVVTAPTAPRVVFAAAREVVQPLPVPLIQRASGPTKFAVAARAGGRPVMLREPVRVAATVPTSGQWFVQLGAYENAGIARDDWMRARHRYAAFAGHTPQGATVKLGNATFYRLSVGGFARADADKACRAYRARGGKCFVRTGVGEQMASWVGGNNVRVASRSAGGVQVASR